MRQVVGAAALVLTLMLVPGLVRAQHWITRDVCDFDTPMVHADLIGAQNLAEMRMRADAVPNSHGRLWRVTSDTGAVSHLFGTLHSSHAAILDLPDDVIALVRGARVVSPEIDFTAPTRRHVEARRSRSQIWRPLRSRETFDDVDLPAEVREAIRARFGALGWGLDAPDRLTLGAVAEVLLSDPCEDFTAGVLPQLDNLIFTLAHIARIPVSGLEHPNAFLTEMNKHARQDTALAVVATYGAYLLPQEDARGRATLTALYLRGELALMSELDRAYLQDVYGSNRGAAFHAEVDAYLIDDRNRAFLEAARADLDAGGLFMAIGAGHLPGDAGMVSLLREAGYTVARRPLPQEVRP